MDNELNGLDPNEMTPLWRLAQMLGYAGSGIANLEKKLKKYNIPILEVGRSKDYHLVRNRDLWRRFDDLAA
jgi:hypothetical protein